LKNKIKGWGVK